MTLMITLVLDRRYACNSVADDMKARPMNGEEAISEAELLLHCLRGSLLSPPPDTNWPALLTLAENHSVLPFIHRALAANGAQMPDSFLSAVRDCIASTEMLALELERLLDGFAQHGIEVVPLKGPVLAEALYGDVTMRSCVDLDLLVRVDDFSQAEKLLIRAGWVASSPADDYQRKFVRNGVLVELHFGIASPRVFPFDLDGMWRRVESGTFRGHPLKAMSETDRALYLLLHGLKHGYGKLIWVLDAARALAAMKECSPREFLERARSQGLEQMVYIGCAMVQEVFPDHISEQLSAALAESPETMRLARLRVEKLLAGEAGSGRGPEMWEFYLQTETETGKRWRRRLTFFIPSVEDYRWTARHGVPRRLALLVRPFRVLAKHGFRRAWRTVFPPST